VRIIGSRFSREALALRAFAQRSRIPHEWVEIELLDDVRAFFADLGLPTAIRTPIVITGVGRFCTSRLRASWPRISVSPSTRHPATCSISSSWASGRPGSRPRSMARRRPRHVALDSVATGGQAGASSRIENYVGFPTGISGDELRPARRCRRCGWVRA
jgi:thioredoxin reductase (NADPH)